MARRPLPPSRWGRRLRPMRCSNAQASRPCSRLRRGTRARFAEGYRALAIVLMHSYRYPAHEQRVAEIARAIGFAQISVSHEVSALIKMIGRGDTSVADAYLSPVLKRHVGRMQETLPDKT